MPQAVSHVLIPIILLSLFRDYFVKDKRNFPLHYVLIGGIAGLIPDLDVVAYYILSFFGISFDSVHRVFSHNIFVVLFFILVGLLFYNYKNAELGKHKLKLSMIFFVIAFGVLIHLLLDFLIAGSITLFYPFSYSRLGINLINFFPIGWHDTIIQFVEAVLLVAWLVYIEIKHKISDFI